MGGLPLALTTFTSLARMTYTLPYFLASHRKSMCPGWIRSNVPTTTTFLADRSQTFSRPSSKVTVQKPFSICCTHNGNHIVPFRIVVSCVRQVIVHCSIDASTVCNTL